MTRLLVCILGETKGKFLDMNSVEDFDGINIDHPSVKDVKDVKEPVSG